MGLINRRRWLWATFSLLMMIGLTVLVMLSRVALRLEAAEMAARRSAAIEENLRLALWRIDTAWAPLIAQEGVRPIVGYAAFAHPQSPIDFTHLSDDPSMTLQLVVLDRFEWSPSGSPGQMDVNGDTHQLSGSTLDFASLWQRLPPEADVFAGDPFVVSGEPQSEEPLALRSRSAAEFQQRNQAVLANNYLMQQVNSRSDVAPSASAQPLPPLVAIWDSGRMLLARRARFAGQELLQGCVLDWDSLQRRSLNLIEDLLPAAALEPVAESSANGGPDMLAALPVRLVPGPLDMFDHGRGGTVSLTLVIAWASVLLAGGLGGILLHAVIQLSERRAAFVTAVTHELRSPLTTFQLYTEMLCSQMVADPAVQRSYLETLHAESLRLNHLVDNVLAYARLQRGRGGGTSESLTLESLVAAVQPRLEQHAARAQMRLVVRAGDAAAAVVRVNVSMVEQILLNLVDNACKYAAAASDRRIVITAERGPRCVALRVRDYGPGLPSVRQWSRPFAKTAEQAAESSPGIGLGLALSRRLAQELGGSLQPEPVDVQDGACFVLRLPV